MTAREKETRKRGMAIGLGTSLLMHAAAGLLFFALAGDTGATRPAPVTIVLTAMPPAVDSPPQVKAHAPLQKKVEKGSEPLVKSEEPRPHPRSVQKAPVAPAVPAHSAAAKPEQMQVAALSAPGLTEAPVFAPEASSPASRGESTAGGAARRDEGETQHGGSAVITAEAGRAAYLQEHFVYIREQILQHLAYPSLARRMGWRGQLTVSFVIGETGRVENLRILKSSGFKVLDDNVLKTIEQIQPFPKPPGRAEIVIPIEYRLG